MSLGHTGCDWPCAPVCLLCQSHSTALYVAIANSQLSVVIPTGSFGGAPSLAYQSVPLSVGCTYLSFGEIQLMCQLRFALDGDVSTKVELLLQLHSLRLRVHDAVFVFGARFACKETIKG